MKAKEVLKALVKLGKIEGCDIATGKRIKRIIVTHDESSISPKKIYLYSFKDLVYVEASAVVTTLEDQTIYLYEI